MPNPKYPASAAPLIDIVPNQATPTSAATSSFVVFNEDALTAQDYPIAPHNIINDDDNYGSNVHVQAAPTGASAIDLYCVVNGASPFTSAPIIRVYGEIPLINTPQIDSPHHVGSGTYENPVTAWTPSQNQWLPLADDSGNYAITMPTTSAMENSAGYICEGKTVYTRGCKRIMVTVQTAGVDADAALIAGCFVY